MVIVCLSKNLTIVGRVFPWGYQVIRLFDGRPVLVMKLHGRWTWDLVSFMLEDLHLFRQAVELGFIR
jgi:hypothetical protein